MLPHLHVPWLPSWGLMVLAVVLALVAGQLVQSFYAHGGISEAYDLHPCSRSR